MFDCLEYGVPDPAANVKFAPAFSNTFKPNQTGPLQQILHAFGHKKVE
jgi:hypothetical protein